MSRVGLKDISYKARRQVRAIVEAMDARRRAAQPQRRGAQVLVAKNRAPTMLVDPTGTLLVRIIRIGGAPIDDHDNLRVSYKPLVDAIASAFGRASDSKAAGWIWEYEQEPWPFLAGTRIEIERIA